MKLFENILICLLVVSLNPLVVDAADVTTGLIAHWPLDGDAKDVIGGQDGELQGQPKWVKGHPEDGRRHIDEAMELDGSSHVNVPDFQLITTEITFVAWINGWKVNAWAGIVGSRTPSACEMIFGDNDFLHYVWNNNAQNTWRWDGGPTILQNEWCMTALTVEPAKATGYVYSDSDGLDQGSNDIPHVEQTVGVLNLGWVDCCGGNRYFQGLIDEVMIYDRALTEDDILQLATQGLAVSDAGKLSLTWGAIKR